MQWGAGDPFQEMVARLSQEHVRQVERLQHQVERLQRQVDRLTAAAPQGGAGPESAWHRIAFAYVNLEETRRNLRLAILQQHGLGLEAGEGPGVMHAALEVLCAPHAASDVAVAYDAAYAWAGRREPLPTDASPRALQLWRGLSHHVEASPAPSRTALWKASAAGIRTHTIMRYCCEAEAGSRSWVVVEEGLILALGEQRFSAASTNLRAQFIHAYQQIYPTDRNGRRRHRPARQRGAAGAPTGLQRSAEPEPAAEESPEPEPAAGESPEASSGPEDPAAEAAMQVEISVESRTWRQPQTWTHNTFLDVDETEEGQSSQCKESIKSYPRERPTMDLEKRKRHRLLKKLAEEDMLPEETSKLAKKVVSWDSPTIDNAELLIRAGCQSRNASDPETMTSILEALRQVTESLCFEDVKITALHDVIGMLLAAMERHKDRMEVQKASLDILLDIARSQCQVLGVCCARESAERQARSFSESMRAQILRLASNAAKVYWQCQETAVKVIARTQNWQEVEAFVSEPHAWKLMDELCYHLEKPLKQLYGQGRYDQDEYNQQEYAWATTLLSQLSEQQMVAEVHQARITWVQEFGWMPVMQRRFIVNGIISGAVDAIAQPLQRAVKSEDGSMDENLVTAGLRAIIDLNEHVKRVAAEVRDQLNDFAVELIAAATLQKFKRSLRSAIAGVLGSLNRGRGAASGPVLDLLLKLAKRKLVRFFEEAPFHHEVLWAVVEVFEGGHLGECEADIFGLAEALFQKWSEATLEQDPESAGADNKDEVATLELAKKILAWRGGAASAEA